jgi:hypothetical protein
MLTHHLNYFKSDQLISEQHHTHGQLSCICHDVQVTVLMTRVYVTNHHEY